jgi:HNH endonuclease
MSETEDFLTLRTCLLSPLPEYEAAADMLSEAADAILAGDLDRARNLVRRTDMPVLFEHTTLVMSGSDPRIQRRRPIELPAGKVARLASRMPSGEATKALFARDGWRCRFCDCRVVPPKFRTAMRTALPGAIRWSKAEGFHGAFIAMSASVDHVVPYSAGGTNEEENLVTACWSCQFGKDAYSLEELGLLDPRARPPVKDSWDGLGRLLTRTASSAVVATTAPMPTVTSIPEVRNVPPPSPKRSRLSHAEWFASLDAIQSTPSSRLISFVDGCSDLDVSWSLNKVLIVRMTAGGTTVEFGVQRDGSVEIPWSISGRKDALRRFAETLAAAIPGAIVYETPKLWNVSKADKRRINVLELLDATPTLRLALERLHSELLGGE